MSRRQHSIGTDAGSRAGRGFTLIEMLVTIAIIMLLASLLLPAVAMARRNARVAAAKGEVRHLEAAMKQYYSEYERWPSELAEGDVAQVSGLLADVLSHGAFDATNNPHKLSFMEFKRFNADGSPINPFGDPDLDDSATDERHFYYLQVDDDYDNLIPESPGAPATWDPLTNTLRRTVIAWTVNPDLEPGDEGYIIGSWQ
jgi:prepilin-type N-terminal cleavage/methylation domain-containing protein